jgi:hypothetical protein
MKSRKSFPLRINPQLYQEIEAWARQEMRSVNSQIEYLLKDAVRKRGRPAPDDRDDSPESGVDRSDG